MSERFVGDGRLRHIGLLETLAVPGAKGFVALAQGAVIGISGSSHRPVSRRLAGRIGTEPGCTQAEAARKISANPATPLRFHRVDAPGWAERYGVRADGAVLVRPDGTSPGVAPTPTPTGPARRRQRSRRQYAPPSAPRERAQIRAVAYLQPDLRRTGGG